MKDAALKLALEALEKHGEAPKDWACKECVPFSDILKDGFQCKYHEAITTIKQALALDKKAENARELGLDYEPAPVQEPVARQYQGRDGVWKDFISEKHYKATLEDGSWPIRKLYTTPPAKNTPCPTCEALARTVMLDQTSHDTTPQHREPLTDEAVMDIVDVQRSKIAFDPARVGYKVARAIEAAHGIKENT
jgi:hypothetical protein